MQYGQVILFVIFCLAIYYIVMILMDLQKANAAKIAEAENNKEEDIDISDEAKQFNPIKITREARPRVDSKNLVEPVEEIAKDSPEADKGKDEKNANEQSQARKEEPIKADIAYAKMDQKQTNKPQPQSNVNPQKTAESPKPHADTAKIDGKPQEKAKSQKSDIEYQEPEKEEIQENVPICPNYRKPVMTDGITAAKLVEDLNAGRDVIEKELGAVIMSCEHAKDED